MQLTIHQQPGEDAGELAERVIREIEHRRRVSSRGRCTTSDDPRNPGRAGDGSVRIAFEGPDDFYGLSRDTKHESRLLRKISDGG